MNDTNIEELTHKTQQIKNINIHTFISTTKTRYNRIKDKYQNQENLPKCINIKNHSNYSTVIN